MHVLPPDVRVSPDVVFRDLEGEAVILDLASGTYFGLNAVATRVWRLLDEGRPFASIVDAIASEFDADRADVERDVAALLRDLRARRLVVPADGNPTPAR
jgi:coenzyme PQQ synthesis protein D (PqqD)